MKLSTVKAIFFAGVYLITALAVLISVYEPRLQTKKTSTEFTGEVLGSGSGYYITKQCHVATAAHVVTEPWQQDYIVIENGVRHQAVFIGADVKNDIAILMVIDKKECAPLQLTTKAYTDEKAYALGFPMPDELGENLKIREGAVTNHGDLIHVVHRATVWPGNSGGALVNRSGHVLGTVVTLMMDPVTMVPWGGEAVRSYLMVELAARLGIKLETNNDKEPISKEMIYKQGKSSVVMIEVEAQ